MERYLQGKKSVMWNFFTPLNELLAVCNFCKQKLSYKSSISNLKQHLLRKHPSIKLRSEGLEQRQGSDSSDRLEKSNTKELDSNQPTTSRLIPPTDLIDIPDESDVTLSSTSTSLDKKKFRQTTLRAPRKIGFSQKKILDEKLLKLVTKDLQPFSIVEDVGFRNYTYALNPSYTLPSRKTLSGTLLPAKYEEIKIKTRDILKQAKSVTITTDCWTSISNEGYIAVTAHFIDDNFKARSVLLEVGECSVSHTSSNLANELRRVTSEWDLENKILLCISDNAANIKKAISEELRWKHLGCIAHTINLIVKDALESAEPLITKVSNIVSHFKKSTVAKNKLDFYQIQNGKQPKKLIQSIATRWNSVYYMLERIKELQEEVRASLAALGKEDWPMLSNQEFHYVDELIQILAPMESTTVIMSSEKHVTLSSVIIIANGLSDLYKDIFKTRSFSLFVREVLENMIKGIDTRFKNIETSASLLLSTFLDPRFKHIGFSTDTASERAKTLATNALTALIDEQKQTNDNQASGSTNVTELSQTPTQDNQKIEPKISIWASFDKKASSFAPIGTKRSRAIVEIQRYLEETLLNRSEDPMEWWKTHAYGYPHLSELVKLKFGTVATSVPCERRFSKSGQIISERRSRIKGSKVQQIMFINENEDD